MKYDSVQHALGLMKSYGRCRGDIRPLNCSVCFMIAELKVIKNGVNCTTQDAFDAANIYIEKARKGELQIDKCKSIW